MATALNQMAIYTDMPKDAKTGLTLPLSKSLGSQELAKHRAMVGVELEVMAKKYDRFGWERDRGTYAHDRMMSDWMGVLQDYPLAEIQRACAEAAIGSPKNMPHEGHIVNLIRAARKAHVRALPRRPEPEPDRERVTPEESRQVMADVGFKPKIMGGAS